MGETVNPRVGQPNKPPCIGDGIVSAYFFSTIFNLERMLPHSLIIFSPMSSWLLALAHTLALPPVGLSTVFVVAFISATLLPAGSEPVVFALVKLNPELFWPAVVVATVGNTLGGMLTWLMGYSAHRMVEKMRHRPISLRALAWLERLGPKACLLSWLPGIGDPLCAVAGWLKLPFWPCALYMAIGKFARYLLMTAVLVRLFPGELPFMT